MLSQCFSEIGIKKLIELEGVLRTTGCKTLWKISLRALELTSIKEQEQTHHFQDTDKPLRESKLQLKKHAGDIL